MNYLTSETEFLDQLIIRYPTLGSCKDTILRSYEILKTCFENKNKLLLCGNGGSAADCEHIVGELMKGFLLERSLIGNSCYQELSSTSYGDELVAHLQGALPAISLCGHSALSSAISNDIGESCIFAQQVVGLGRTGDVLLGISTSGNSLNVYNAMLIAKEKGLRLIGLTGNTGGKMNEICDVCICVGEKETYKIQELHLPIYHCLCAMLEHHFYYSR